ncbi:hypothetical protein K488DRAFT_90160 [Vararia minispora EC-137]|uniref:Uncharacterized protein n=1 Tax=Vararia minispora EC-137 TaxID=1314806 RepID=A0ACB8Q8X9_9AGAM|nr:hypothetical protein K488DRAFT_90160 [Vararia minispora EC-137]
MPVHPPSGALQTALKKQNPSEALCTRVNARLTRPHAVWEPREGFASRIRGPREPNMKKRTLITVADWNAQRWALGMVDDNSLATGTADDWAVLVKTAHVFAGIIFWEVLSTAAYELSVLCGSRKYLRTIWVHLGCRLTALLSFVFFLLLLDSRWMAEHCQASYTTYLALVYLSYSFGIFIMVMRTVAIWRGRKLPVLMSYGIWLAALALNIREVIIARAVYNPAWRGCVPTHTHSFVVNIGGLALANGLLFALMLAGLVRFRDDRPSGLVLFLWREGVICMAVVTVAEVPSLVMLGLGINDIWNVMFFPLWQAALYIPYLYVLRSLPDSCAARSALLVYTAGWLTITPKTTTTHSGTASYLSRPMQFQTRTEAQPPLDVLISISGMGTGDTTLVSVHK